MPVLALLMSLATVADHAPDARPTVEVMTGDTNDVSQKLSDALSKGIDASTVIRAPTPEEDAAVRLAVMSSPDGKKFGYIVDVVDAKSFSPKRLGSMAGKCAANAIDACAADILKKAAKKVES